MRLLQKPQLRCLDLFCGGGGASVGLWRAGFTLTGIDIVSQPDYPFDFIRGDALTFPYLDEYDFIWASPPCQAHSIGTLGWRNSGKEYIDLVIPIRDKLRKCLLEKGIPYCIENVPYAPIRKDLLLCGEMFGLNVIRHRIFEVGGFRVEQPRHPHHKKNLAVQKVWTGGDGVGGYGTNTHKRREMREYFRKRSEPKRSAYMCVAGHGGNSSSFKLAEWQKAMGIDWISNKKSLAQCVPPAYSEYIGRAMYRTFADPSTPGV